MIKVKTYNGVPIENIKEINGVPIEKIKAINGVPVVLTPPIKVYGIEIDTTNSSPAGALIYTDDAIGMTAGSANWDTTPIFSEIKPCLLKNGVVQYYLNSNDFTKKEDGTSADITSGNDGDVMIEIPKLGYKIETVGTKLSVKITNELDNPDFKYYAHTRDVEGDRDKLYIGAYLGTNVSSKLRSLSGKSPTTDQTIGTFRTQAQANNGGAITGYDQMAFYPLTLLQCLFLIKYKDRDSQTALGRGYVDGNSSKANTGGTNTKGMYYGETGGKQQMKFAGIEDFWGNLNCWIDGLFNNSSRHILTAYKSFNNTGSGYMDNGQGSTSNFGGNVKEVQGTSETGFIIKSTDSNSSYNTHYCDFGYLYASYLPVFGGYWGNGSLAGAFRLDVGYCSATESYSSLGGRLMYL